MGVRELAQTVGLHPNTAREHLEQLVLAGLVLSEAAAPSGRGRPAIRYRAEPSAAEEDPGAYRALATVLATELSQRPDATEAAIRAGERWGNAVVGEGAATPEPDAAVGELVRLLDELGFAPDPALPGTRTIKLRRCPFGVLSRQRGDVVCATHLGLMRGALHALDAPLDAVELEPFVEPDLLCLAHVRQPAEGAPTP